MEGQVRYQWVRWSPNEDWKPAQIGPEIFSLRLIGSDHQYATRDFEMGPFIETPDQ